jgi:hypothetical protein
MRSAKQRVYKENGQGFDGLAGGPKDAFDEALDQAAGEARTIVLKAAKGLTAK